MIPKAQSLYLDTVRILCAFGVLLWHASQPPVSDGAFISPPGHLFVVVFFVLSGFVIAASTDRPEKNWRNYAADRLSRLSCVVIPGLFLTYLLDYVGMSFRPEVYGILDPTRQFVRFFANFFYLQQHWFLNIIPSSNGPFWSIAYEFWYYVIFGIWLFISKLAIRNIAIIAVFVFIGPKILLLFPSWLLGVAAYIFSRKSVLIEPKPAIFLFFVAFVLSAFILVEPTVLGFGNGEIAQPPLFHSGHHLTDNIYALLIAGNFWLAGRFANVLNPFFSSVEIPIRWLAQRAFSLYIYHVPILWCLRAITNYDAHDATPVFLSIAATIGLALLISEFTEQFYPLLRTSTRNVINRRIRCFSKGQMPSKP